jgi:hypothetical protein
LAVLDALAGLDDRGILNLLARSIPHPEQLCKLRRDADVGQVEFARVSGTVAL